MPTKGASALDSHPSVVSLGDNPVNAYQARVYAQESSPSPLAVMSEASENGQDNSTSVAAIIDVELIREEGGKHYLTPKKISFSDNGVGLTHRGFLTRFCTAYCDSEIHYEADRAGRNGVGTKTYTSIADRVIVTTTTAHATEGLDEHRDLLIPLLPDDVKLPRDGEPDSVRRVYEFQLHNRSALPKMWSSCGPDEMGTTVELADIRRGTELCFENYVERLSYNRSWLKNSAHKFTVKLTGTAHKKDIVPIKPWELPERNWLTKAVGRSDQPVHIHDETSGKIVTIPPVNFADGSVLTFDFRVAGKAPNGQMHPLEKPALLLEVCGALPYAPDLEGGISARTFPLLGFVGLAHASSIGAFCNVISGWANIYSLELKGALRNNKTTLASGPAMEYVQQLREYLYLILKALHGVWYAATRSAQEDAANDVLKEAQEEVNLAFRGPVATNEEHHVIKTKNDEHESSPKMPIQRHRWECGNCRKRWLAIAGFTPAMCAEIKPASGPADGCGSSNIGLAKNQPHIGDCLIKIDALPDVKIPAVFQMEEIGQDLIPVIRINQANPRYVELHGSGSMSSQAQRRLKQYLVDISLITIADYRARAEDRDFVEELGSLYFNRMRRSVGGIKEYEKNRDALLKAGSGSQTKLFDPVSPDIDESDANAAA